LLKQLVTSERSPFCQHFDFLELGPMKAADAQEMLQKSGPPARTILTENLALDNVLRWLDAT
jgi:hypothetical protein